MPHSPHSGVEGDRQGQVNELPKLVVVAIGGTGQEPFHSPLCKVYSPSSPSCGSPFLQGLLQYPGSAWYSGGVGTPAGIYLSFPVTGGTEEEEFVGG